MSQLYLIRHGNTFDQGQQVLRVGARSDLDLSLSGCAQAAALGQHFSAIPLCAVISSPLKRAQQTAEAIIARQENSRLEMRIDPRLNELDYGPDEGQSEDKVRARLGEQALLDWEHHATVPQDWQVNPDKLIKDWQDIITELKASKAKTIALVTSNGLARFILPHLKGHPKELKLKTGAFACIDLDCLTLRQWNIRP